MAAGGDSEHFVFTYGSLTPKKAVGHEDVVIDKKT